VAKNLGGLQRKWAKQQTKKLMEGSLVSDQETRQAREQAHGVAEAGLQAQQAALARSQQQMAQGAPVQAGATADMQGKLAQASADAAVKASGQAQDFAASLQEKRKGQALAQGNELANRAMQKQAMWADFAARTAEAGAEALAALMP
jgi:hypothetical protein